VAAGGKSSDTRTAGNAVIAAIGASR